MQTASSQVSLAKKREYESKNREEQDRTKHDLHIPFSAFVAVNTRSIHWLTALHSASSSCTTYQTKCAGGAIAPSIATNLTLSRNSFTSRVAREGSVVEATESLSTAAPCGSTCSAKRHQRSTTTFDAIEICKSYLV